MISQDNSTLLELASRALDFAKDAGATAADVVVVGGQALSAKVRLGELEGVERSEDCDLGLRVFNGKSHAIVATSELDEKSLKETAILCMEMARVAPEDPHDGLADSAGIAPQSNGLDLFDASSPSATDLKEQAEALGLLHRDHFVLVADGMDS